VEEKLTVEPAMMAEPAIRAVRPADLETAENIFVDWMNVIN
jgi:hypothetical protein